MLCPDSLLGESGRTQGWRRCGAIPCLCLRVRSPPGNLQALHSINGDWKGASKGQVWTCSFSPMQMTSDKYKRRGLKSQQGIFVPFHGDQIIERRPLWWPQPQSWALLQPWELKAVHSVASTSSQQCESRAWSFWVETGSWERSLQQLYCGRTRTDRALQSDPDPGTSASLLELELLNLS